MPEAHRRKKDPNAVCSQIMENAARLAMEQGLSALTIETVATAAGVTKGGLLHHFPNKQALKEAVFEYFLVEFDAALQARMEADERTHGRFTRAYLELAFDTETKNEACEALWISSLTDPDLRKTWARWFKAKLDQYGETEDGLHLEVVRFAADGIWSGSVVGVHPRDRDSLRQFLIDIADRRFD